MALQLAKICVSKNTHNTFNNFFRSIHFQEYFKRPIRKSQNTLGLFYQDILSKKLLNSDDAKTEVFLKLLSDNLKFQLLQNVDETKLEHLLKLNDLKEVNKNEWSKLYKNKASFPSEEGSDGCLKLYKDKDADANNWGWWGHDSQSVVLVFKTKGKEDLQMKMFKDINDKQLFNLVQKGNSRWGAFDRVLFSTSLGLSTGSILSTLLLESLYLPSLIISTTAFTSTLVACFFYNRLCNSKLSVLHRKGQVAFDKLHSNTESCLENFASQASDKLYSHLLICYVAFQKFTHLLSNDGKLKVGETLQNNLIRWMQRELALEMSGDIDLHHTLELMEQLGLVRWAGEDLVEVVGFETALQSLQQSSQPSKFLSGQALYHFD